MPTAYAGLANSLYASHAPPSGPDLAYPVREAVVQPSSTRIDPAWVYYEA